MGKALLITGVLVVGILVGYLVPFDNLSERSASTTIDTTSVGMETNMETANMTMDPESVEVDIDYPIPEIEIVEAIKDDMGAYSLKIAIRNFIFAPQNVDKDPVVNEGHAHLYVNGEKVGREYGEWIYVPASYLEESDTNRIKVTLNANTHGAWTYLGTPIESTIIVE